MQNVLELQYLVDDLLDFLELLTLSMIFYLKLIVEEDRGGGPENKNIFC